MEHYELYHGTKRKEALEIIATQKFIVKEDEDNKLLLGTGAYFYFDKINAIDWNSRDVVKRNKSLFPSYIELKNMYGIVCANCEVNENNILNLDSRESNIKYKKIANKIKKYLKPVENYKDRNELSTILNFLQKKGLLNDVDMVMKTVSYPVDRNLGITLPKKIVCIKNTEILNSYKEVQMTKAEYKEMKLLYE